MSENSTRPLAPWESLGQACARILKGTTHETLDGRVAIVTGAASGIGRASALLFAAEGAKVVAVDRAAEIEETASLIAKAGGTGIALKADASSEADVAAAVDRAVSEYGTLDVLYANAGVSGGFRNFLELSAQDWMDVLSVNLIGVYLAIKHAARIMVPNKKGAIVCTASVAGLRSGAGGAPYSASKAGVISLTQLSANLLAGTGVRVNAVCPGLIENGHDQADLRQRQGTRQRRQDRPAQSPQALRPSGRDRRHGAVPGVG